MLRLRAIGAAALACLAFAGCARISFADSSYSSVPGIASGGDKNVGFMHFPAKPTSVTVDGYLVRSSDGAVLAGPVSVAAVDAFNNDEVYRVNLADSFFDDGSSWDPSPICQEETAVLHWKPAGVTCSSTPAGCPWTFEKFGGEACKVSTQDFVDSYTFASSTVPAQGIDAAVLTYYGNRGQLPVRWRQKNRSFFNRAQGTQLVWEVYKYRSSPAPVHLSCVVETTTDPASALPSFSGCVGN